jgi:hypothetical protein
MNRLTKQGGLCKQRSGVCAGIITSQLVHQLVFQTSRIVRSTNSSGAVAELAQHRLRGGGVDQWRSRGATKRYATQSVS